MNELQEGFVLNPWSSSFSWWN